MRPGSCSSERGNALVLEGGTIVALERNGRVYRRR
jgi:hypothetical protein